MATLEQELASLADAVAVELNEVRTKVGGNANGNISSLNTTDKSNVVAAVNEVDTLAKTKTKVDDVDNTDPLMTQARKDTNTYSRGKIDSSIQDIKNEILGGVGPAFDTLQELEAQLSADGSQSADILAAQAKRVAADVVQLFTTIEKDQARSNIDALGQGDVYAKNEVFSKAELGDLAIALAPYFQSKLAV